MPVGSRREPTSSRMYRVIIQVISITLLSIEWESQPSPLLPISGWEITDSLVVLVSVPLYQSITSSIHRNGDELTVGVGLITVVLCRIGVGSGASLFRRCYHRWQVTSLRRTVLRCRSVQLLEALIAKMRLWELVLRLDIAMS